ncbi:hypothetical protein NQ166_10355 [Microbacterium sp. zg.Y1090]|nr:MULTISPECIES: hypothetical protein [unclassified Microbacterium]MCR2813951.1 hypothetical protein [Microbacterium sp. zg.Y1084]MCR2819225.1 hypothetical protein [Microbacterium sp. zg.Y1090]MDL5487142.1 hypothetical protein [Microbacterium sp. zg-Y1211]WIM29791.1 hypothetical protein QNO26_13855 [Microbacterium sp. zg-Y1090]
MLAIIGVLLIAALGSAVGALYAQFYSPSAFVTRYVTMLSEGRAADALAVPGVVVDSADLEAAGLPPTASEALLRQAALAGLSDVRVVSEEPGDDATRVTVAYKAGPYPGETTFDVERAGWLGVAPTWRFAQSPLAVIDLTVLGAMQFTVNGFDLDKRQVSPDGADVDPAAPVPLLVFSPGVYSVAVDTAISATPGVAVLSDSPAAGIRVELQAQPTEQFVSVVQERVDQFLAECAAQQVLQPAGCPFGFTVRNRITELPTWTIAQAPVVSVEPDGAGWKIPVTDAVAHIDVEVQSLFDGSVWDADEDVPFQLTGTITVLPDGTASILVSGVEG